MRNQDIIDMATRAAEEIEMLRRKIDRLEPAAEAYHAICAILRLLPVPAQGYGEDVAYRLRKQAEELRAVPTGDEA